ncbi:ATP-binding protein [Chamaesiphon sp. VAR_48_metabat_135_sub]|uniref:sensor histidine kinase n=1 Tax=Chamaesiphon sp. VAR_48_metabat_135_sub TaxID=2964699 RepID=UPI00286C6633|nr:CHASE3 domain-containing protein [Chamaesiphon sp. VAR_48_metabat_135_sub]
MFAKPRLLTYWSKMSLSYRGAAIVTIPALCLLATMGAWFWSRVESNTIRTKIAISQERIANTKELLVVMLNAETGVRGYLISGDPDFLEPDRISQKSLPIALSNLKQSTGNDPKKLAQLNSIQSQIQSIQKLIAKLQTVSSVADRSKLLRQGKQKMDALRQEINTTQAIEQIALDRERDDLSHLQSLIHSLQLLFTVTGIMSTVGGIYLFQLLERELRQREAQIHSRDSLIETLTTDIIDGIVILDRLGQIETVNPALIEMFGYTAIDLLKCPLMRLFATLATPQSQPLSELVTWLQQQPKLGRIWQLTAYRRDGTSFPIELSLSEIQQEHQTIAIIRDVSEQANLTKQLQTHLKAVEKLNLALIATNFTLNSRNQELAEFAYATAHDLKTPLRGIATLSEWIEEEVRPYSSEQLDLNIHLLRQRIYRLNNLIDGLWEYSNLGQNPVTPEPIELATFLEEIKTALLLPPNFKIQVHPTDLHLTVCKSHLRKVIEELLENALKHHDALEVDGHDLVSAVSQDQHRGQIGICVESDGEQLEFIITDDGPGIEREHHQRVFRLFETLKPRDVQENTGIGLAIAKKLVERVGGKIWLATPASGKGLAVHFTWPQHPPR